MEIYTGQMNIGKRNNLPVGITIMDITVKSGIKAFAPTWDILMEYKESGDEARYRERFRHHMTESLTLNRPEWIEALKQEKVLLLCYCRAGKFCHRHIIAEYFARVREHLGQETIIKGEIQ